MRSSAEIMVVETLGSPKRLNSASELTRMRSAVRRGALRVMMARSHCEAAVGGFRGDGGVVMELG